MIAQSQIVVCAEIVHRRLQQHTAWYSSQSAVDTARRRPHSVWTYGALLDRNASLLRTRDHTLILERAGLANACSTSSIRGIAIGDELGGLANALPSKSCAICELKTCAAVELTPRQDTWCRIRVIRSAGRIIFSIRKQLKLREPCGEGDFCRWRSALGRRPA